ncbi:hypothetical protein SAICODRAFT_17609 [Saitoella complicata NRRL Y-17804]|uniref:Myb-like domain-containing protein n=1 Tax=Saitoella complicata (strain BCRC 22490 / CBS 7301 / JCM 7358 / NBRC 10748 / NRRL Y-17804) TaxID=698492 RepID=A0A0E9NE40_SAICN|nr:uncharacterized protein SAICODRAFT_17609 [Saitoella complicata NRRL Y-17804]ODQ54606.1 hypothetical protein SAICODRAFT_17609 [Saitoella complicata NRRL Y-17804]GAO48073.1 hypothetical protein G7K_2260-t1 [Saitoella complicata NRRL Y-17804]
MRQTLSLLLNKVRPLSCVTAYNHVWYRFNKPPTLWYSTHGPAQVASDGSTITWTKEDESILLRRASLYNNDWPRVSEGLSFPPEECEKQYEALTKVFQHTQHPVRKSVEDVPGVFRKGPWSVEETKKFQGCIEGKGQMNACWKDIDWEEAAKMVGTRTPEQCLRKWRTTSINPAFHKTGTPWTVEEKKILKEAYEKHGPRWALIEKLLPGRSAVQIELRASRFGLDDKQYKNGSFTDEMLEKIEMLLDDPDVKHYRRNQVVRWTLLAKDHFPDWSPSSLRDGYLYYTEVVTNCERGPWSQEETERLRSAVERYLDNPTMTRIEQWAAITKEVGTRSRKGCRDKWVAIQHRGPASEESSSYPPWTNDQVLHLISLTQQHSFNWPIIAAEMVSAPGTKNHKLANARLCRNVFWRLVEQKARKRGMVVEFHLKKLLESFGMAEKWGRRQEKGMVEYGLRKKRQKSMWTRGIMIRESDVEGEERVGEERVEEERVEEDHEDNEELLRKLRYFL